MHYIMCILQYLILSMVTYGLFEVSAKKWLVPAGDTAPTTNSLRGLGMMGVHTILWMWYVCMPQDIIFHLVAFICRPPLIILHYAGVEHFVWPSRRKEIYVATVYSSI